MNTFRETMNPNETICICKNINLKTIVQTYDQGAKTVNMIKYKTGAGSGPCHGVRCTPKIQEIIDCLENVEIEEEA